MASNEETNASGTDTRPPMLVESDYDSWKIRTHRYIRGKPLAKLIWNSIQNGPSPHPMVTDAPTEGQTGVNMPRIKLDSEFTPEETNRENADTHAEIILSQGLPRHIFNILNQTNTAKEIWDNVEMLMQGSGRTLQQRKEDLFDETHAYGCIGRQIVTETVQRRAPRIVGNDRGQSKSNGYCGYCTGKEGDMVITAERGRAFRADDNTTRTHQLNVNAEPKLFPRLSLENQNLTAELAKCKLEIVRLDTQQYPIWEKGSVINASNVWDTDETLASAEVSMAKMKGKTGSSTPIGRR
ncbi:hypothetical protein Tco_1458955 [Tanacetum coccineum]